MREDRDMRRKIGKIIRRECGTAILRLLRKPSRAPVSVLTRPGQP
jgi:hypothetical protein